MEIGDIVKWLDIKAEPKETKAQGRYTEATLVRELEKFGIGRPSTFASLLSVIQDKNYVESKNIPAKEVIIKEYNLKPNIWPAESTELKKKVGAEKNKLVPTELGKSVLQFILKHFDAIIQMLCEKIRNLSLEFSKSTKEIELQNSAQSVNRALKESEDNMLEI